MSRFAGRRYWLVGASQGLGLALARQLSAAGAEVVLSARDARALGDAAATMPGPAQAVPCDVTDPASVAAAARAVGRIDGLVWLAAAYWPMRAQDWDAGRAQEMVEVGLAGCLRVLGHVVPAMVARDAGHIVLVGSLAATRGLPGAIGYGCAKAGILSLAESLHADLHRTGIRVQVTNPGFIRTRLTARNAFAMPQIMQPEAAARAVFRHMQTTRFRHAFPAPFAWALRLGQVLPERLWLRLVARG